MGEWLKLSYECLRIPRESQAMQAVLWAMFTLSCHGESDSTLDIWEAITRSPATLLHPQQRVLPVCHMGEPLITNIMWRNLIIMALFQVSVLLTLNFKGISLLQLRNDNPAHADKVKNTFIFNTFVLCQVFNEFNSRKPDELNIFKGISGNHLFIGIIAVTVILQALIVEFLGKFASTVKLSWQLWLVSIGLSFFSWPLAFVGKLLPIPKRPFGEFFACCCPGTKQAPDDGSSHGKEGKSGRGDVV